MNFSDLPRALWQKQLTRLRERRGAMNAYLKLKVDEQDWHGVADAAMDLREIDAEMLGLKNATGVD